MRVRRVPRVLARILLGLLWLAVACLVLEVGSRLQYQIVQRRNPLFGAEVDRRRSLQVAIDESLWETPFVRYRRSADIKTELQGREFRFQTDSRGYRTREVAIPKPPRVFRIVCVGASTTVEGETNERTYPGRLEARLRELFPDREIEVVNCGISGISASHELDRLPEYLAYEPDLILEYNAINDLTEIASRIFKRAPRWQATVRRSHFAGRAFGARMLPDEAEVTRRIDRAIIALRGRFHQRAADAGVPVAFASFAIPDLERAAPAEREYLALEAAVDWGGLHFPVEALSSWVDLYNERLQRFCEENGILYFPLAEEMPVEMRYFTDLCHMTPEGIERKAEIFARYLAPMISSAASSTPIDAGKATASQ